MDTADQRDVFCPRCRYNLRGLPTPRCPECGLTFAPAEWQAGVLREHVLTSLDRCDPWQPHQVLLRSLYELIRGALRPGWLLAKLDLDGPLRSAGLMFGFGVLWLYVFITVLVATAIYVHTGASPFASLIAAAVCWAPGVLAVALVLAAGTYGLVSLPQVLHVIRLNVRQHVRLAAHWLPAMGAYVFVPLIALPATPDLVLDQPAIWPGLMVPALGISLSFAIAAQVRRGPWSSRGIRRLVVGVAASVAGGLVAGWLAGWLLPTALDPPLWVYF